MAPVNEMAMLTHEYRTMFEIEEDYWWYRGVRIMLAGLLARYVPGGRARLLDAGCGTGKNLELLRDYGDAWGVDISAHALDFCLARGLARERLVLASVVELPFAENLFDLAISFDVVCNIADDVGAIMEIGRVLRPDGHAILLLPAFEFLWSAHDVAVSHKYRYTAKSVADKITRAGLKAERVTYVNTLFFPLIALARFARRPAIENGDDVRSDLVPLPRPLNALLTRLFRAEMRAALSLNFPYGLSVLAIARK